jgi:hypothetical protein
MPARLRPGRGQPRLACLPQHALDLGRKALLRAIVFDGLAPHFIANVRGAIGNVREHALGDLVVGE